MAYGQIFCRAGIGWDLLRCRLWVHFIGFEFFSPTIPHEVQARVYDEN